MIPCKIGTDFMLAIAFTSKNKFENVNITDVIRIATSVLLSLRILFYRKIFK